MRTAGMLAAVLGAAGLAVPACSLARSQPDLVVTKVRGVPANARPGSTMRVAATVRNRGRAGARRSVLGLYLSPDRRQGGDPLVGKARVPALRRRARRTVRLRLVVTALGRPGRYFVLACADARRRVPESSERNNCRAVPLTITSVPGTAGGPAPSSPPPGTTPPPGAPPPAADVQPRLPVRAAFYYPWFPEAWNQQGFNPFTRYHPTLGFYDSSSTSVIDQHLAALAYGGFQVAISSWWGQGKKTDMRLPLLLSETNRLGSPLRWAVYYEPEGQADPTVAQLVSDLTYIRDHYGGDGAYFRIGGRFVVFVYADTNDACAMADRWKQANAQVGAYVVLKVFTGFRSCTSQPDGWHQYAPANAVESLAGYSYTISPGFWKPNETTPRLARDLTRFEGNVRDMSASGAPFQLVTTFNEWGEGTAVEDATEWDSASGYGAYLDALHLNGQGP